MTFIYRLYYVFYSKVLHSFCFRVKTEKHGLRSNLIKKGKTKWLDLGAVDSMDDGFFACDIYQPKNISEESKAKFFIWDATKPLIESTKKKIGSFDFIRMQHVFEHFTPEDGRSVLINAYDLLHSGGVMLITVPDLRKFVSRYKRKSLDLESPFSQWAYKRIEKKSPSSFYFSVFTHSLLHQSHLWCYDKEGLDYIIRKSLGNVHIEFLTIWNKESSIPFTHNRPLEDLCVKITKS